MAITFDDRALLAALTRLEQACDDLGGVADQVEGEALGHAILGARRSVYDTAASPNYQRTGDYLRGFQARARATKNAATVTVWNDVDYAPYIEYGVGPNEMTPQQILAQARANPMQPLYFGRSGLKHTVAGPAVYPATVFALWRMQALFAGKVREAAR